jgi:hypothetical protein
VKWENSKIKTKKYIVFMEDIKGKEMEIIDIVRDGGHWGERSWESQGKQANKQMDKGSVHV